MVQPQLEAIPSLPTVETLKRDSSYMLRMQLLYPPCRRRTVDCRFHDWAKLSGVCAANLAPDPCPISRSWGDAHRLRAGVV